MVDATNFSSRRTELDTQQTVEPRPGSRAELVEPRTGRPHAGEARRDGRGLLAAELDANGTIGSFHCFPNLAAASAVPWNQTRAADI